MPSFFRIAIAFFGTILLISLWLPMPTKKQIPQQQQKLLVMCTTSMIADAVASIAQDRINLRCLMGPGVDPHLYRPTQRDMHLFAQADIIFYNGLHLEGKMTDLLGRMQRQKPTYAVGEALPAKELLTAYGETIFDPHVWHDVKLWMQVVTYICSILQQHDPEYHRDYEEKTKKYLEKLQKLDEYVKIELQKISEKQRILVTAHDAFRYFGKSYGIRVEGLQGTSTDSEISTRDMQERAHFIIKHKIKAIFVESSVPHKSIQALQQAVLARGWKVIIGPDLYSDALADAIDKATYYDMIKHNVDAIVSALR